MSVTGAPAGFEFRIMPSGDGRWYWEVIIGRHVVKRGVADDEPNACQDASDAARGANLIN
jgi:hypothetical protein